MAIFQKIKDKVKSAFTAIGGALQSGNQSANASSALQGRYIPPGTPTTTAVAASMPLMTPNPSGDAYKPVLQTPTPSGSSYGKSSYMTPAPTTQLPVTINAGQQRTGRSMQSSTGQIEPLADTTISAKTLGFQSNASIGNGGAIPSSPLVLSSAPSSSNANKIDNTKLAGVLAGVKQYNQTTGQLEDVVSKEDTNDKIAKDTKDLYNSILGTKQSVYDDPDVIRAQETKRKIEEAIKVPTSELNAIIAKQNQDLLQLRQTGSKEGVTEAVYGGQANAINYNAAIRALPLQASISALQGNLELATEYLSELTKTKSDQINNQYEYNKNLLGAISGAIEKKDQRVYEEMKSANENSKREAIDLENYKETILTKLLEKNPNIPTTTINRIANATNRADIVNSASKYLGSEANNLSTNLTTGQQNNPFIQKLLLSAGGKPLTDTFAQKLDKGLTVLNQIGVLQTNIKDVKTGPIIGAFRGANPWDTNAQTIKAQLNSIVPNLARGVYGEVGVLTDNDIAQYSKTLPNLKSTEDIRNAVLGITVDLIGKSVKRTLEVNAANGKDVSRFVDLYTEMEQTRDGIFSQISGYKGTQGQSQSTVSPEIESLRSKYNY